MATDSPEGQDCGDSIDWERLARREMAMRLRSHLTGEVSEEIGAMIAAIERGEEIEPEELVQARTRLAELDQMVTEALVQTGALAAEERGEVLTARPSKMKELIEE